MKTIWVDLNSGTYGEPPIVLLQVDEDDLDMIAEMSDQERISFARHRTWTTK